MWPSRPTRSISCSTGEQVHFLRAARPIRPGIALDLSQPPTTNRNNAYASRVGSSGLAQGPAQLRHPSVQLGHNGDARPQHAKRSGLQQPHRRRRQKGDGLLRTPQALRLRRPDQLSLDPHPRLQPPGPLRADLRQRPGDDLPAHLRTGRIGGRPPGCMALIRARKGRPLGRPFCRLSGDEALCSVLPNLCRCREPRGCP